MPVNKANAIGCNKLGRCRHKTKTKFNNLLCHLKERGRQKYIRIVTHPYVIIKQSYNHNIQIELNAI